MISDFKHATWKVGILEIGVLFAFHVGLFPLRGQLQGAAKLRATQITMDVMLPTKMEMAYAPHKVFQYPCICKLSVLEILSIY